MALDLEKKEGTWTKKRDELLEGDIYKERNRNFRRGQFSSPLPKSTMCCMHLDMSYRGEAGMDIIPQNSSLLQAMSSENIFMTVMLLSFSINRFPQPPNRFLAAPSVPSQHSSNSSVPIIRFLCLKPQVEAKVFSKKASGPDWIFCSIHTHSALWPCWLNALPHLFLLF